VIGAIAYASCYVYSPMGAGAVCQKSRLLRALLKSGDASFMVKYALRVRQQAEDSTLLAGFFDAADVLVPVPGCVPYIAGDPWAADHLSVALVDAGLGGARVVRPAPGPCGAEIRDRRSGRTSDGELALRVFRRRSPADVARKNRTHRRCGDQGAGPCWPRRAVCRKHSRALKFARSR